MSGSDFNMNELQDFFDTLGVDESKAPSSIPVAPPPQQPPPPPSSAGSATTLLPLPPAPHMPPHPAVVEKPAVVAPAGSSLFSLDVASPVLRVVQPSPLTPLPQAAPSEASPFAHQQPPEQPSPMISLSAPSAEEPAQTPETAHPAVPLAQQAEAAPTQETAQLPPQASQPLAALFQDTTPLSAPQAQPQVAPEAAAFIPAIALAAPPTAAAAAVGSEQPTEVSPTQAQAQAQAGVCSVLQPGVADATQHTDPAVAATPEPAAAQAPAAQQPARQGSSSNTLPDDVDRLKMIVHQQQQLVDEQQQQILFLQQEVQGLAQRQHQQQPPPADAAIAEMRKELHVYHDKMEVMMAGVQELVGQVLASQRGGSPASPVALAAIAAIRSNAEQRAAVHSATVPVKIPPPASPTPTPAEDTSALAAAATTTPTAATAGPSAETGITATTTIPITPQFYAQQPAFNPSVKTGASKLPHIPVAAEDRPAKKAVAFNMERNEYKSYYDTVKAEQRGTQLSQEEQDRLMAEHLQKMFEQEANGVEEGHGVRHGRRKRGPPRQVAPAGMFGNLGEAPGSMTDEEYARVLQEKEDAMQAPTSASASVSSSSSSSPSGAQSSGAAAPEHAKEQKRAAGGLTSTLMKGLFGTPAS